jgi:hypothetical protein
MKYVILLIGSTMLFLSGCASTTQTDPGVYARQTCTSAGFIPGTDKFQNCFITVIRGEHERQSRPSFAQQYLLNRAANVRSSQEVVCQPWLNGMRCVEQ